MIEHTINHNPAMTGSSNRAFGLVFSGVFAIVAYFPLLSGGPLRLWFLVVAIVFLLLALAVPGILAPANRLWMKFGMLLHSIVSPIALGIVFYLAVMPTGLFMRLLGKDPLRLRLDPVAESYWIRRVPPGPAADSLNNQF